MSHEPNASRTFYEQLFGWTAEEGASGYVVFALDGERVGGLMAMPSTVPEGVPSLWLVYFSHDVSTACAERWRRAARFSCRRATSPRGRFAVLEDSAGAVFAVFENA